MILQKSSHYRAVFFIKYYIKIMIILNLLIKMIETVCSDSLFTNGQNEKGNNGFLA